MTEDVLQLVFNLERPWLHYPLFLLTVGIYTKSYDHETIHCLPGASAISALGLTNAEAFPWTGTQSKMLVCIHTCALRGMVNHAGLFTISHEWHICTSAQFRDEYLLQHPSMLCYACSRGKLPTGSRLSRTCVSGVLRTKL